MENCEVLVLPAGVSVSLRFGCHITLTTAPGQRFGKLGKVAIPFSGGTWPFSQGATGPEIGSENIRVFPRCEKGKTLYPRAQECFSKISFS